MTNQSKSSTSARDYLFQDVVKDCGHEMRVFRMAILFSVQGPCDDCWRQLREAREEKERRRFLPQSGDKESSCDDPTIQPSEPGGGRRRGNSDGEDTSSI